MTKESILIAMIVAVVLMAFQVFIGNNFDRFGFATGYFFLSYFMYDLVTSNKN